MASPAQRAARRFVGSDIACTRRVRSSSLASGCGRIKDRPANGEPQTVNGEMAHEERTHTAPRPVFARTFSSLYASDASASRGPSSVPSTAARNPIGTDTIAGLSSGKSGAR
jgi:hypothetical protein